MCRRRGDRRQNTSKTGGKAPVVQEPGTDLPTDEFDDAEDLRGDTPIPGERREKVQRRRQIDPTTCERDYTDDEIEFMHALDAYKRSSGRMFPTCSEILEVVRGLGYTRVAIGEESSVDVSQAETELIELAEIGTGQSS